MALLFWVDDVKLKKAIEGERRMLDDDNSSIKVMLKMLQEYLQFTILYNINIMIHNWSSNEFAFPTYEVGIY